MGTSIARRRPGRAARNIAAMPARPRTASMQARRTRVSLAAVQRPHLTGASLRAARRHGARVAVLPASLPMRPHARRPAALQERPQALLQGPARARRRAARGPAAAARHRPAGRSACWRPCAARRAAAARMRCWRRSARSAQWHSPTSSSGQAVRLPAGAGVLSERAETASSLACTAQSRRAARLPARLARPCSFQPCRVPFFAHRPPCALDEGRTARSLQHPCSARDPAGRAAACPPGALAGALAARGGGRPRPASSPAAAARRRDKLGRRAHGERVGLHARGGLRQERDLFLRPLPRACVPGPAAWLGAGAPARRAPGQACLIRNPVLPATLACCSMCGPAHALLLCPLVVACACERGGERGGERTHLERPDSRTVRMVMRHPHSFASVQPCSFA